MLPFFARCHFDFRELDAKLPILIRTERVEGRVFGQYDSVVFAKGQLYSWLLQREASWDPILPLVLFLLHLSEVFPEAERLSVWRHGHCHSGVGLDL